LRNQFAFAIHAGNFATFAGMVQKANNRFEQREKIKRFGEKIRALQEQKALQFLHKDFEAGFNQKVLQRELSRL
jgi:Ser/Thr protein kinase RdoA (MazF antagonist)